MISKVVFQESVGRLDVISAKMVISKVDNFVTTVETILRDVPNVQTS